MGCHARSRSTAKRATEMVLGVERAESDAYVTACLSSALGPAVEHMYMSHRRACRPYVDGALWVVARAAGQRPNARMGWYWELREPDQMHMWLLDRAQHWMSRHVHTCRTGMRVGSMWTAHYGWLRAQPVNGQTRGWGGTGS